MTYRQTNGAPSRFNPRQTNRPNPRLMRV
ncbi:MAG: hypothetical protein V7608_2608, partial [Hyphomicrobiales bacterium]